MRVSEAIRSLSSVPPLLRTIDNIPETASPAELVDISLSCPAIQSQRDPFRIPRTCGTRQATKLQST